MPPAPARTPVNAEADGTSRPAGPLLEVDQLTVSYRSPRSGRRLAVNGVSFIIDRGEILALVGESGCGKTSVARALPRLVEARGRVVFEGCDLLRCGPTELRGARRRLGMVFQDPVASLNPKRRVADIVAEPLRAAGRRGDHRAAVRSALALVGLPDLESAAHPDGAATAGRPGTSGEFDPPDWREPPHGLASLLQRRPAELSGGQCQRVSLARALVASPRLLICDEATSALDARNRASVLGLLAGFRQRFGLAVLFITHDLAAAWQLADRVAIMHQGRLVENGPPEQVLARPTHDYTRSLVAAVPTGHRRRRD